MAWRAPDGEIFDEVDPDVISRYYSEEDYEDELDRINPDVEVLGGYYGEGYIRKRLSYGDFRAGYIESLYYYARDPESLGFEEIDAPMSRKSPQKSRSAPRSNTKKGKAPAKKQPKKTAGTRRR